MEEQTIELTATRVDEILMDCLSKEDELNEDLVIVEGVVNNFSFHSERLQEHKDEIIALLSQLPTQFQQSEGGGWSFLNACMTKDGTQWGEHRNMEQLFVLGLGIGKVRWQMPKEMWSILPGGMPYVVVLDKLG